MISDRVCACHPFIARVSGLGSFAPLLNRVRAYSEIDGSTDGRARGKTPRCKSGFTGPRDTADTGRILGSRYQARHVDTYPPQRRTLLPATNCVATSRRVVVSTRHVAFSIYDRAGRTPVLPKNKKGFGSACFTRGGYQVITGSPSKSGDVLQDSPCVVCNAFQIQHSVVHEHSSTRGTPWSFASNEEFCLKTK